MLARLNSVLLPTFRYRILLSSLRFLYVTYLWVLQSEAIFPSETSSDFHPTRWRYIAEDITLTDPVGFVHLPCYFYVPQTNSVRW
jgi:hypothetical protein